MNISINNQKSDITLENEKNLGEVLASIEQWLEEGGFSLSSISVNNERIEAENLDSVLGIPTAEISELQLSASSWAELLESALQETVEVFLQLPGASNPERNTLISNWIASAAARLISERDPVLYTLVCTLGKDSASAADPSFVLRILEERIEELTTPGNALQNMNESLELVAQRLEDLPLDLQTGKDQRAAETLNLFTTIAEKILRIVPVLTLHGYKIASCTINDMSFESFMNELADTLKELLAAYEKQDTILVGDLSEYELAPRLRTLHEAVNDLIETSA